MTPHPPTPPGAAPALTDKAEWLQSLAPLFPDVSDTEARLQALESTLPAESQWQHRHFEAAQTLWMPLWSALAPAYVTALSRSIGSDAGPLAVQVEHWPATVADHQQALHQLLSESRLRQGWREYALWLGEVYYRNNDQQQKIQKEQAFRQTSLPLCDIPLYQSSMRVSCQQLVCLPVDQWQALRQPTTAHASGYCPHNVHAPTVNRLATRVAQVFNSPPLVDVHLLQNNPGWDEPVVWNTNSGQLTGHINSHGMHDRCEHGWQGGYTPLPAEAAYPEWRYEGFYGLLRVTLEDGTDWMVAVLAPLHFVRRLAYSVDWYQRFG